MVGPRQSVDPDGQLDSISCPTATFCLASDAGGSVIMWNGATWSGPNQVIPAAAEYPGIGTTVSCPSPEFCMVINSDGDYATYSGSADPLERRSPAVTGTVDGAPAGRPGSRARPASSASVVTVRQLRVVAVTPSRRSRKVLFNLVSP